MKRILIILFFFIYVQYSWSIEPGVTTYSDSMQVYLDRFRKIALTEPDNCQSSFDTLCDKAVEFNEYHAIAKGYNIIGIGYAYQNKIPEAINFFLKANEIAEQLEPTDILVDARNNIANMYITQGDTANSLYYFNLGLEAAVLYGNRDKEILTRISLASLQLDCNQLEKAKNNLSEIEANYAQINELDVKAYYHIAQSRYLMIFNHYDSALYHARIAYTQYSELNDLIGITTSNYYVGINEFYLGKIDDAIIHCLNSYTVADTSNLAIWQDQSCECLTKSYEKKGDLKQALFYHKKWMQLKDELRNDERTRDITKLQLEVEFAKERVADSLRIEQEKMEVLSEQEIYLQKEKTKSYILYSGIAFVTIVALLFYRGNRRKQKTNQIILEQKNTVEQKQQEIMDSIAYAKRLQDAILPSNNKLKSIFKDYFILYQPKDIVSGDFYWTDQVQINNENITLFAVADCTGHGVPGAMVSVVCSNALRRTIHEFKIIEPAKILDKVSELVIESFENDLNEIKDGMDISLISIRKNSDGKTWLQFSGANNPIWLIKNLLTTKIESKKIYTEEIQDTGKVFIELKGNRQPVGKYLKQQAFESIEIELDKDDLVYMFTDGFHDQFGGENEKNNPKFNGKKMKYNKFRKIVLKNFTHSLVQQNESLYNFLERWQGDFEQTDDICVVGIKI